MRLKLMIGSALAAGSLAVAGLAGPAGVAIAAPGDDGGGAYSNGDAGGAYNHDTDYPTGNAGGAYSREAAGGGYATGNAGGAWYKEFQQACADAEEAGETLPPGCAS